MRTLVIPCVVWICVCLVECILVVFFYCMVFFVADDGVCVFCSVECGVLFCNVYV